MNNLISNQNIPTKKTDQIASLVYFIIFKEAILLILYKLSVNRSGVTSSQLILCYHVIPKPD